MWKQQLENLIWKHVKSMNVLQDSVKYCSNNINYKFK